MSDNKFTPGPWRTESIFEDNDARHDICLDYEIPGAGSPILLGSVFCDEDKEGPGYITPAQATANARLMAASPNLLAACEAALGFCVAFRLDVPDWNRFPEVGRLFALMRTVIYKAKDEAGGGNDETKERGCEPPRIR